MRSTAADGNDKLFGDGTTTRTTRTMNLPSPSFTATITWTVERATTN